MDNIDKVKRFILKYHKEKGAVPLAAQITRKTGINLSTVSDCMVRLRNEDFIYRTRTGLLKLRDNGSKALINKAFKIARSA